MCYDEICLCVCVCMTIYVYISVCLSVCKAIDRARDMVDTELTALAAESYSRAYGVSIISVFSDTSLC